MYKFAIIDDSLCEADMLNNKIAEFFSDQIEYRCDIYNGGENFSYENYYDAIFLDIEMPSENGFDIAHKVNQSYSTKIIFITRYDHYVVSSFDYHPFHFIQKNNFDVSVTHVLKLLRKSLSHQNIKVMNKNNISDYICTHMISYIHIENGIVTIHTFDNEVYTVWKSLSSLWKKLDTSLFVMLNQSVIVNMNFIQKTHMDSVVLRDSTHFTISTRKRNAFKKAYQEFLLK